MSVFRAVRSQLRCFIPLMLFVGAVAPTENAQGQGADPLAPAAVTDPKAVVVTVNGEPITRETIDQEISLMLSRMSSQPLPPQAVEQLRPRFEPQAVNQIALKMELKAYAVANGVEVTDASIDAQLGQIAAQFPNEQVFDQALSDQGISRDELKDQINNQILVTSAVEHYIDTLPDPSEETLKTYFNEHIEDYKSEESVTASHILIGFEQGDTDEIKAEKKTRIEGLKKDIDGGADFAALAKEHSSCPSGREGGDLGSFGKGQMVPPFEEAAFALEPGKVSDVVETQFGYHLIRVSEHEQAGTPVFDEAREEVEQAYSEQQLEDWFQGLIAKAKIEKN